MKHSLFQDNHRLRSERFPLLCNTSANELAAIRSMLIISDLPCSASRIRDVRAYTSSFWDYAAFRTSVNFCEDSTTTMWHKKIGCGLLGQNRWQLNHGL